MALYSLYIRKSNRQIIQVWCRGHKDTNEVSYKKDIDNNVEALWEAFHKGYYYNFTVLCICKIHKSGNKEGTSP